MLTIFFRAAILYSVSVFAVRMMGKRQIAQLQPYELVEHTGFEPVTSTMRM